MLDECTNQIIYQIGTNIKQIFYLISELPAKLQEYFIMLDKCTNQIIYQIGKNIKQKFDLISELPAKL